MDCNPLIKICQISRCWRRDNTFILALCTNTKFLAQGYDFILVPKVVWSWFTLFLIGKWKLWNKDSFIPAPRNSGILAHFCPPSGQSWPFCPLYDIVDKVSGQLYRSVPMTCYFDFINKVFVSLISDRSLITNKL